jgi:O-antigen/teichoic acid export membrane protein
MFGADLRARWRVTFTPARLNQLWYVPLLSSSMALMLIRTLVAARLLDVDGFAKFSGALLISNTFCMLNCLGLLQLLQRELPIQIVRHREVAGQKLIAQCLLVASGCAILGLLAGLAGFSVAGVGPALFAIGIFHGLSQQVFLVATVESRSRGEPFRFAQQNFARSVGVLTLSASVAMTTRSANWTLMAEAVLGLILTQFALRSAWARSALASRTIYLLALRHLKALSWASALSLMAVTMISFVVLNADRWIAAQLLVRRAFAEYAFAWTILLVSQASQAVINASVYPLLARRFAGVGTMAAYRVATYASLTLLSVTAIFAMPAYWAISAAIRHWFPTYSDARALLPIFMFVAVLRLSDFWSSFLLITRLERRLLLINLSSGVIAAAIWLVWVGARIHTGLDTQDVAALAALLTTIGYIGTAASAWRARRGG